jgi:hypothetical protein
MQTSDGREQIRFSWARGWRTATIDRGGPAAGAL